MKSRSLGFILWVIYSNCNSFLVSIYGKDLYIKVELTKLGSQNAPALFGRANKVIVYGIQYIMYK